MDAVVVKGLTRTFKAVRAVQSLDLTIEKGALYGLVGPDGAGKTTTLRLLAGLLAPDAGSLQILGGHPDDPHVRERVGMVPQRRSLYGDLSVQENLDFFGDLFALSPDVYAERSNRLLQVTRLDPFRDRRADALSGGMYAKLALACALLHQPELLLLDEPTNGVDPVSRRDLWALLHEFVNGGTTVIVATAYLDEAERCGRVGLIHRGKLLDEGDPIDLGRGYPSFEAAFVARMEAL